MKRINLPLLAAIALTCNVSHAELVALSDNALSQESGAGVALVLEDFVFDVNDAVTTVTGIESSDQSQELEIQWTELYIMGEGSENGTIKTPGQIGNLMHPWLVHVAAMMRCEIVSQTFNQLFLNLCLTYAGEIIKLFDA